ncbi:DUF5412 family protein [Halobacillus andaensis]|nr:DUF5412 family protein [Halobacillus andaensis]MBP2004000.1 hypothetical protein [Halobacillus andaensis]
MYKKSWLTSLRSWITIVVSFLLSGVLFIGLFINSPNARELMKVSHSPDGQYEIHVYRTNGGAATSHGVKAKIYGPLWFEKTVYSNYPQYEATVKWENDYTVIISQRQINLEQGETYGGY